jgi:hypothetical protein
LDFVTWSQVNGVCGNSALGPLIAVGVGEAMLYDAWGNKNQAQAGVRELLQR